ncbi:hypothetical protein QQ045_029674 [Rhodiola kirilowii]
MSSGNRRRSTSQRDVSSSSQATANPNMDMDDYLHLGPIDPSLLTMQSVHRTEAIWRNQEPVCLNLLGAVPDHPKLKSMGSKTWFDDYLNNMPADADEETLKKYARAYILCLLGLTLMANLSGDQVALHYLPLLVDLDNVRRYSWGSAVLAFQYSQLCRASNFKKSQIGGCALLLQFWCWERMRIGRPQPYDRDALELEDDIHPYLRPYWSYL